MAVIYISHRLEELMRIGDFVTVLRDGRLVASRPASEVSVGWIIERMLGDKARPLFAGLDIASMAQSLRMSIVDQRQLGVDLRLRMRPATA